MKKHNSSPKISLSDMQGHSPYDAEELAALRKRAWHEHGIFIVSLGEQMLSQSERIALTRIANSLYGKAGGS